MLNLQNIFDTIDMIDKQHLDIRTITMGISLLDCVSEDPKRCCDKIYDKICRRAEKLVQTGRDIESEFGIPIVNKRISVTTMAMVSNIFCRLSMAAPLYSLCMASKMSSRWMRMDSPRPSPYSFRMVRSSSKGALQAVRSTTIIMVK